LASRLAPTDHQHGTYWWETSERAAGQPIRANIPSPNTGAVT
jgi:hypothetical protein